ncbi:3532_t:CDS:2, partial [Diversispora eburnea]
MIQPLEVTEYDVIILGTGLVESILAGALARIGKSVLHLDANGFYGGSWSSLNFRDLLNWIQNMQEEEEEKNILPNYDELARFLLDSEEFEQHDAISKIITEQFKSKVINRTNEIVRHVSTSLSNFERIETLAMLLKESKKYNIELSPKLMSCRGELIELLINSGVGRYLDFKAMETTYIYTGNDDNNFDK